VSLTGAYWQQVFEKVTCQFNSRALPSHDFTAVALGEVAFSFYQMPPRAAVIAYPFTPPVASLHRNAMTSGTSLGSNTASASHAAVTPLADHPTRVRYAHDVSRPVLKRKLIEDNSIPISKGARPSVLAPNCFHAALPCC
jgi:hypothetical protein